MDEGDLPLCIICRDPVKKEESVNACKCIGTNGIHVYCFAEMTLDHKYDTCPNCNTVYGCGVKRKYNTHHRTPSALDKLKIVMVVSIPFYRIACLLLYLYCLCRLIIVGNAISRYFIPSLREIWYWDVIGYLLLYFVKFCYTDVTPCYFFSGITESYIIDNGFIYIFATVMKDLFLTMVDSAMNSSFISAMVLVVEITETFLYAKMKENAPDWLSNYPTVFIAVFMIVQMAISIGFIGLASCLRKEYNEKISIMCEEERVDYEVTEHQSRRAVVVSMNRMTTRSETRNQHGND